MIIINYNENVSLMTQPLQFKKCIVAIFLFIDDNKWVFNDILTT